MEEVADEEEVAVLVFEALPLLYADDEASVPVPLLPTLDVRLLSLPAPSPAPSVR